MFNHPQKRYAGFKLALAGCLLAVIVIGLGAFTRLADAGLGCPDWPGCYGHALWPDEHHEVIAANTAYPETPVEHDKTWPEMVHRYFASSLGLLTIALLVVAFKKRRENPRQPIKLPIFLLAFIILQGMFGMWTVTLKLWPQVVTLHLLGGFTTFGLLWLLTLRLNNQRWQLEQSAVQKVKGFKGLALVALVVVATQIALGGWTTSNYAAVACPDLPTCQTEWLPAMDFSQAFNIFQAIGPNYLGGNMDNDARVAIHFSHRIGAIVTSLVLLWVSLQLFKNIAIPETKRMAVTIVSVLVLQVCLGVANIIFNFPVAVAVAHNLGGALLLLAMITLNYRVNTCQAIPKES